MANYVLQLADAAVHFRKLNQDMLAVAERGLLSAAMKGVAVIKSEIVPSRSPQPVDRGVFRAGWKYRVIPGGAEIFNDEAHTPMVEGGVRASNVKASRALVEALLEWTMRKGIVGRLDSAVVKKAKSGHATSQLVVNVHKSRHMEVVWAIINRMKKRGIHNRDGVPGQGILRELIEKRMSGIMDEEITRELKRLE